MHEKYSARWYGKKQHCLLECAFLCEKGKAAMKGEALIEKSDGVEGDKEWENSCNDKNIADLVEDKGRESSSSSELLSSEITELDGQSQGSAEDSPSPTSMGWPVRQISESNCTSPRGSEEAEKQDTGNEIFEQDPVLPIPGIQI